MCPLVQRITVPPPFIPSTRSSFAQVASNSLNPGVPKDTEMTHHATFIDDNLMDKRHCLMIAYINHSTGSDYIVFGNPYPFWHKPCLSEEKFDKAASNCMEYLGLVIDTVSMTITYPLAKRQSLLNIIDKC